jgi:hypothetical protein
VIEVDEKVLVSINGFFNVEVIGLFARRKLVAITSEVIGSKIGDETYCMKNV